MNDGFGFMLGVLVLLGILHGYLKTHSKKPMLSDTAPICTDSEFDSDDIDKDVDEMPDDSLIYDVFN